MLQSLPVVDGWSNHKTMPTRTHSTACCPRHRFCGGTHPPHNAKTILRIKQQSSKIVEHKYPGRFGAKRTIEAAATDSSNADTWPTILEYSQQSYPTLAIAPSVYVRLGPPPTSNLNHAKQAVPAGNGATRTATPQNTHVGKAVLNTFSPRPFTGPPQARRERALPTDSPMSSSMWYCSHVCGRTDTG